MISSFYVGDLEALKYHFGVSLARKCDQWGFCWEEMANCWEVSISGNEFLQVW